MHSSLLSIWKPCDYEPVHVLLAATSDIRRCVQAAQACCSRSKPPSVRPSFQPRHMHAASARTPQLTPVSSREEGYYRTGVSSSAVTDEQAEQGKGHREMPLFAADGKKRKKGEDDCTKHKYSSGALAPGLMVRAVRLDETLTESCRASIPQLHELALVLQVP